MALQRGARIGSYDVTALIGEGGMGQVYQWVVAVTVPLAVDPARTIRT